MALQAPLRDRFKELPETDIKEILHQRMLETGTYKSLPKHVAIYEALKASMECANREELLTKMDKSRKRRRNGQDLPLSPPDLDLSKRRRQDTNASGRIVRIKRFLSIVEVIDAGYGFYCNVFSLRPRLRCDRLVSRSKVIENQNQVMAASDISISSDVSVERVGSSFSRLILIGSSFVEVSVALKIEAAGHSILGHSLYGYTPPDTTVTDSSTPLTTSESSARNSSSESSTGPSRKRCRSPAATMTSSIHATRALVPSRADLLLSHKRFRDFISPKDSVKEGIDTDVLEDIEANAMAIEVAVVRDVVAEVDAENGVNILKSIDEGPFQMGMFKETLVKCEEGAFHLGPERPRVYSDLSPEEKDRYNVDSRATNILLQGSLKDIYTLINHYTDAKDIWDNVKMLLEGGQDNAIDEDMDEQLTMLMANLSSAYPVYGKAGPSYDSDILSEYVKDNTMPVVQSSVSSIQNDPYMMILNDMHEQPAQHESVTAQNNVVDNSLSAKRATSKEQVELGSINPLHSGLINTPHSDKTADENVLAPAPTRSDDQILPFVAWVFIGKSNFVLDLHKRQKNPIFHIFVDILHNTNFFKAFTASASEEFTIFIKDQHLHFILLKKTSELPKSTERRRLEYKQPKPKPAIEKSSKLAHVPKSKATKERPSKASTTKPPKLKPAKEKSTKTTPPQKAGKGKIRKVRKVKSPF
uniref:Integrase, catalytic region, zinc finger, CCHC-type, peptidase aspartic, catalytic n=1 Tax=Tanacetum cinerariifolium TaxID=118510 RepID=A0A699GJJ6_TANCI|nr:integrase, catalytic region, zinc finger, CCHC-type, peptidase aspartic, catalytic [Tanacetum cinerariifolium]